ncbi:MAG: type II toxin-antitoxin system Phd/YefM family antitoxin [Reyranella sp.]|uniref:type II toxin-antitoxin system Phd/YefM family antitoxin n=1 Tax=Reyranella sp. TaxID=1929291 RepID=UPI003D10E547
MPPYTSCEFNHDFGRARKAAERGPVFITDRGKPAYVLLTIEDYRRLSGGRPKIADLLAMPGLEDADLPVPERRDRPRSADPG